MKRFKRPNLKERLRAAKANSKEEVTPLCFCPVPDGAFDPIAKPRKYDWLRSHKEDWRGQTVSQFCRVSMFAIPHGHIDTIELIPVGPVPKKLVECLRIWQEAFFRCRCKVGRSIPLSKVTDSIRCGDLHQLQLKCGTIFEALKQRRPSRTVLVQVAVTMADLYPDEEWNFVYGQAVPMAGVGVFSFARYFGEDESVFPIPFPIEGRLDKIQTTGIDISRLNLETNEVSDDKRTVSKESKLSNQISAFLYRCAKVLTHETGHLFGMRHCIHYECLMSGCNHREEFDRRPVHLCPVCLRKLCIRRNAPHKIDPISRYQIMARLAGEFQWANEKKWNHGIPKELSLCMRM